MSGLLTEADLPEMVYVPGGTFQMGSNDYKSYDEQPVHQVNVASFFMSKFVVTQAQWQAVAALPKEHQDLTPDPYSGENSNFRGSLLPAICVSWDDAKEFCARLSQATKSNYQLPSEAEWEYACRAGTISKYNFGDEITPDKANYNNTIGHITPAGKYSPNAFGLYDMHGNVWEWCEDTYRDRYDGAKNDGTAWVDDNYRRVIRGGSWLLNAVLCRSATRSRSEPDNKNYNIGFRVVRSKEP
jgi:formylglycine-generating enzyme required for sulfatase activity